MNIGIIGHMGSGKTTQVGTYFDALGFTRIHPAVTLRKMLRPFLLDLGYGEDEIDESLEGLRKREPLDDFPEHTFTTLQQTLGTEWGRNCIHPDIWTHIVKRRMRSLTATYNDSIRFHNEAEMILEMRGVLIRIVRPLQAVDLGHVSEQHVPYLPYHFQVTNNKDTRHVTMQLDAIMAKVRTTPWEELVVHRPRDNA